mgnify:CR=1 FL=1
MTTHLMNTYARQPVAFVRGEGAYLWDEAGKRYLDAVAGVAVNGLGHAHPKLVKAIADQAATLIHTSNLYRVPRQEELADRLCELADDGRMDLLAHQARLVARAARTVGLVRVGSAAAAIQAAPRALA